MSIIPHDAGLDLTPPITFRPRARGSIDSKPSAGIGGGAGTHTDTAFECKRSGIALADRAL